MSLTSLMVISIVVGMVVNGIESVKASIVVGRLLMRTFVKNRDASWTKLLMVSHSEVL